MIVAHAAHVVHALELALVLPAVAVVLRASWRYRFTPPEEHE